MLYTSAVLEFIQMPSTICAYSERNGMKGQRTSIFVPF